MTLPIGHAGDVRHAVENLLYEYAARADELDYAGIGALFRHGRLRSHGGVDLAGEFPGRYQNQAARAAGARVAVG